MDMNKFKIENLDLYYGDFKALKNINLNIGQNEITAFIGPSGCGKSTLLKSLNRMNDLVEGCKITGKVLLDNEDIYGKNIKISFITKIREQMKFQNKQKLIEQLVRDKAFVDIYKHFLKNM